MYQDPNLSICPNYNNIFNYFNNNNQTNLSNFSGNNINWEIQKNLSISLPLFLEIDIFNSKKINKIQWTNKKRFYNNNILLNSSSRKLKNEMENLNQLNDDTFYLSYKKEKELYDEYAELVPENKRYSITLNNNEAPPPWNDKNEENDSEKSNARGFKI